MPSTNCNILTFHVTINIFIYALFSGQNIDTTSFHIAKNIISNYVEPSNWNLPLITADSSNLSTVRCNIIQVCLQTEGIGKFAVTLQKDFNEFLLKTLYLILERAGIVINIVKTNLSCN